MLLEADMSTTSVLMDLGCLEMRYCSLIYVCQVYLLGTEMFQELQIVFENQVLVASNFFPQILREQEAPMLLSSCACELVLKPFFDFQFQHNKLYFVGFVQCVVLS